MDSVQKCSEIFRNDRGNNLKIWKIGTYFVAVVLAGKMKNTSCI